jgi:DNA-binding FadR family transcriptional regulator
VILSDAAKAAVTNRANVSNIAPPGDVQAVNGHKAIAELCEAADVDADEARAAAREAVAAVGGRIEPQRRRGGLATGRMRTHINEVWWVPRNALHD